MDSLRAAVWLGGREGDSKATVPGFIFQICHLATV